MSTGKKCLDLAMQHLGEPYVFGAVVPKDQNPTKGPWDCAELVSWSIFQAAGILYGVDNHQNPSKADAYTGYFKDDAEKFGEKIDPVKAAGIPGAILLRYGSKHLIGHVVISDGAGGTIEAMGAKYGVVKGKVAGRRWDTGILVPGIYYEAPSALAPKLIAPAAETLMFEGNLTLSASKVKELQTRLKARGFDPGPLDGIYGAKTSAAVHNFQLVEGLVADGEFGEVTNRSLSRAVPTLVETSNVLKLIIVLLEDVAFDEEPITMKTGVDGFFPRLSGKQDKEKLIRAIKKLETALKRPVAFDADSLIRGDYQTVGQMVEGAQP